ncbi:glutathione S-transferase family protein [Sphingomonas sp. SUN019]|uniref:glutathione S-transferase family protein n=1 Tax=Sphingomonas sp. SUN019 TaxID=2937788 RepID=UPI00216407AD|nr:glutathione S-transferase family protein [Sphingomonas sp. SUN019]UVO49907.1 glutathione S-transferase family protein [Sphingomonas sp. SUN019]
MGMLIDGRWTQDATRNAGAYKRPDTVFRERLTVDGRHAPDKGRYHLYISLACPWASRTNMARTLKGLTDVVGMSIVHPDMLEDGWTFAPEPEPLFGSQFLHQIYARAAPDYTGRVTVPVLWDRERDTIVNNESGDIVRILDEDFGAWADPAYALRPAHLAQEIDALQDRLYETVNNGVYRAGFAGSQEAYEAAVVPLFDMLRELDARLATRRFLMGDTLTEPDIRLFTTCVRFDAVYHGHFKCNLAHLWDLEHLSGWLRDVYALPGIAETVDLEQITRHYYGSQRWVNPSGIVPLGPPVDFTAASGRTHLGAPS